MGVLFKGKGVGDSSWRKKQGLVIRDNGNSFKIVPSEERDDFTSVIEKEEWKKSRQDMERHLMTSELLEGLDGSNTLIAEGNNLVDAKLFMVLIEPIASEFQNRNRTLSVPS
ncbi:hypothetical protein K7X08_002426 [Anisodus acutangulus]|uniref:Uncharacterized protein n=1 Tax=Anisodus acutangulus TaxID=402998 RepID=A0A9Q1R5Y8_9SOLA|nr:hypothetical protein K7X08_002426 [Anisodus acutangulus]